MPKLWTFLLHRCETLSLVAIFSLRIINFLKLNPKQTYIGQLISARGFDSSHLIFEQTARVFALQNHNKIEP